MINHNFERSAFNCFATTLHQPHSRNHNLHITETIKSLNTLNTAIRVEMKSNHRKTGREFKSNIKRTVGELDFRSPLKYITKYTTFRISLESLQEYSATTKQA